MYLFLQKYLRTFLALLIGVISVVVMYNSSLKSKVFDDEVQDIGVFSIKKLAQFDGVQQDKLYLALLGSIFDVTEGKQHYEKGGSYNYFVGKDGSRAFVTGDFKDESQDKDLILDLSCNDLYGLIGWKETLKKKYKLVGVLIGRYYDQNGKKTEYSKQLDLRLDQCDIEKEQAQKQELKYPPCNIAWSLEEGSKVWCTKTSGGVKRNWIGVPRQLYTPGEKKPRCVCVNPDSDTSRATLKKYDNCLEDSTTCILENESAT